MVSILFKALGLLAGEIVVLQFLNLSYFLFVIKGSLLCIIASSAKLPK